MDLKSDFTTMLEQQLVPPLSINGKQLYFFDMK